jgi:hypothetical protein
MGGCKNLNGKIITYNISSPYFLAIPVKFNMLNFRATAVKA